MGNNSVEFRDVMNSILPWMIGIFALLGVWKFAELLRLC